MADLMQGVSEYETGTLDTAAVLVNNVSPMNANQMNGVADAIIQMQHVLGAGPDLVGSAADLATRLSVQMSAGGVVIPVGSILLHCGALPSLFVNAFGQEETRTGVTAALFDVCGTTFGAGNGVDTFNVPNLQGRGPVGIGTGIGGGVSGTGAVAGGAALANVLMGAWRGEETHLITQAELPNYSLPVTGAGHSHALRTYAGGSGSPGTRFVTADDDLNTGSVKTGTLDSDGASSTPSVTLNGGSTAHNVVNPQLGLRFIIKY